MRYIYSIFYFLLATSLLLMLNSNSSGPGQTSSAARTGAPSEGNCTSCHASSTANYTSAAMSVQVRDASNNVVTSYTPGQTYTVSMQMSGVRQSSASFTPQFGGQLTALRSANNTRAGTLSAPSSGARVITIGTKSYLEHTQRSATGLWTASWTAPASGTGSVNLYAYGLAVFNGSTSGDLGAGTTVTLSEAVTPSCNISVTTTVTNASCVGTCNGSIAVAATGGTAPYTFRIGTSAPNSNNVFTNLCAGGYSVTATDANGCTATTSANMTANAAPTAGITGSTTGCGSVSLTATGGTSYLWSNGSASATVNLTASGTYSVTVTNGNGCTATASTNVTVNAAPTAGITGSTTGCGSVSLTATGGTNFLWSNGSATATVNLTASGTYSVTVTNGNGCTATASTNVTVNAAPTAGITGSTTGCGSVSLTATGGTNFLWSNGSATATVNLTSSGTYSVTVTNGNGCTASGSTSVTVTPSTSNTTTATACDTYTWSANGQTYTASGSYTQVVGCITENLNVTITPSTISVTDVNTVGSYVWNGTTYTNSGSYSVTNACVTSVLNVTITPSSIVEATNSLLDFKIYPNPAQEIALLRYTLTNTTTIQILIFDQLGRFVDTGLLSSEQVPGEYTIALPILELNEGIYNVKVITPDGGLSQKLVVVK